MFPGIRFAEKKTAEPLIRWGQDLWPWKAVFLCKCPFHFDFLGWRVVLYHFNIS